MRILLTGANGFIGRYLLARLVAEGHEVIPAVRRPAETDRLLVKPASIRVDFNRDCSPADWLPRLAGIDAVINCAGILQGSPGQSIAAIHAEAPIALFKACELAGVRRVIQISAISAGADTDYARTKAAADAALAASSLDWMILRPSLVYASGAYGGTALFRALAVLPFAIPLIGAGEQLFQPIHVDDLCAMIVAILASPQLRQKIVEPVGPQRIALKDILVDLRRWLGFSPAPLLHIPPAIVGVAARIGDVVGGTVNTTALRQLEFDNAGSFEALVAATGIRPRGWHEMLLAHPAQPQDRWAARLYFLRPALRWAIAAVWILSAVAGLVHRTALVGSFAFAGVALTMPVILLTSILDLIVGAAVLTRWRPRMATIVQLTVVAGYTAVLTLAQPSLWLEPFGPLLKNIPFVLAVLVLSVLESER